MRHEWARIVDGRLTHRWLPNGAGELSDGTEVSQYADLPESVLIKEGWVRIIDEGQPDYDPTFYSGTWRDLEVIGDEVHAVYHLTPQDPRIEADGNVVRYYDITREGEGVEFRVEGREDIYVNVTVDNGIAELELDPQGGAGLFLVSVDELSIEVSI